MWLGILMLVAPMAVAADGMALTVVDRPDTRGSSSCYVGNRAPLEPSPLIKLPIGSVQPHGWVKRMLQLQGDGFHGHLTEISSYLIKENNAWLSRDGRGSRGWEEVPYWLKGFQDCAWLLGNERMIAEARSWIEGALLSQQPDGWFGPGEERTGEATDLKGRADLWPNMIMLFCLQSYYEQTADKRVPQLMERYFKYLAAVPEGKFLVGYWPTMRAGDLLYSIYWLYNRNGDAALLDLADRVHRHAARWDEGVIDLHNVNLAQGFREPAVYYVRSRDLKHLKATEANWNKIRELYGQVPGGMFGGDENCRPGYSGPRQAIETCGMAEEMLSDEIMLAITGDLVWAERCENVAFNSSPASMTPDLKALRYLTSPNLPQSDHVSKAPGVQNGGEMFLMNPHAHRCCQHNAGHGWPYYAQHLWYATPDNGLAAVLYAPGQVTAKVADGKDITFVETTHYPFGETVSLALKAGEPLRFPLYLRLPAWCNEPVIILNGRRLQAAYRPGAYARIERTWRNGDRVDAVFKMRVRVRTWEKNQKSVSVDRGPLSYSLKIGEKYERHGGTDQWPAWDIYPTSPWNYGLVLSAKRPEASFKVVQRAWPVDDQPFEANAVPVHLKAKGRRIQQWELDEKGLVRELQASPVRTTEPEEEITLIPMGAARLRISAFPTVGTGVEASEWVASPAVAVTASHCNEQDSTAALTDGVIPKNSGDTSIPRFTWWDHRGSAEWVQWEFPKPKAVSSVEVYWFDDTGLGSCRVPESWQLYYRKGAEWAPVENPSGYGIGKDRFNTTRFNRVKTDGLRIEVKLRDGNSGGILEWRAE